MAFVDLTGFSQVAWTTERKSSCLSQCASNLNPEKCFLSILLSSSGQWSDTFEEFVTEACFYLQVEYVLIWHSMPGATAKNRVNKQATQRMARDEVLACADLKFKGVLWYKREISTDICSHPPCADHLTLVDLLVARSCTLSFINRVCKT
jgi:hypothetical protein